jgi:hypothetical protein
MNKVKYNQFDRECPFKEEWVWKSDKEKYNNYYTEEKLLEMKITSSRGGKISINNEKKSKSKY